MNAELREAKMTFDKLPPFEERAVAFLDVLGFTRLI